MQAEVHVDEVGAGTTVDGHHDRALYRRVPLRDDRRPGYIEPQGHIAKADTHATSMNRGQIPVLTNKITS